MDESGRTLIIKASGEKVPFDVSRLRRSLEHSKAEPKAIESVIQAISAQLHENMSTKEIYRKAFSLLRKTSGSSAARYKLKAAILELGPAGFAFEKFVAEVLKNDGYSTQLNMIEQGVCVKHEIDVIAERANVRAMIECKFHSDKGKYSDVKIPLYIQSRFKDVEATWAQMPEHEGKKFQGVVFEYVLSSRCLLVNASGSFVIFLYANKKTNVTTNKMIAKYSICHSIFQRFVHVRNSLTFISEPRFQTAQKINANGSPPTQNRAIFPT